MNPIRSSVPERLEARIAPAGLANLNVFPDGKKATWNDVDGDLVTLTANKGVLLGGDSSNLAFLPAADGDLGQQLALLNLSNAVTTGLNLTFTAKRQDVNHDGVREGDGSVNVGWIYAPTSDLGTVSIPGDLARLNAGDSNPVTPAVSQLTVGSAGSYGAGTQGAVVGGVSPALDWIVYGRLGALTVKGDFFANLNVYAAAGNLSLGTTGPINIWGDLIGGNSGLTNYKDGDILLGTGYLLSTGAMGPVKVLGSVLGSDGKHSGSISSRAAIASLWIGHEVEGGSSGDGSGELYADGAIGSVYIGGSLVSGRAQVVNDQAVASHFAGTVASATRLGKVTVVGNVLGGASFFGGSVLTLPGSGGKIDSVTIGGTLSGGTSIVDEGQGAAVVFNGIYSDGQLGPVKIGSVFGRGPLDAVHIVARGLLNPTKAADALAIASVTVARGAYGLQILASFNPGLGGVNPDVQIGPVKIGNNWTASSISAGISTGTDLFLGDDNDAPIVPPSTVHDNPAIRARIASIVVGGTVVGSGAPGDAFGFVAEEIGSIKLGSTVLELVANIPVNPLDDFLMGFTHDFRVREFARPIALV